MVLAVAELLGSLLHFEPWLEEATVPERIGIAIILLIVAGIMVWHHGRLENRIKRHQAIMAMTRVFCVRGLDYYDPNDEGCALKFIHDTLEGFIYSLEHEREMGLMNVSLLVRDVPGMEFRILDQYPSGTFPVETRLSPTESAAAIAAAEDGNALVYIPSTRQIHGVRILFEGDVSEFMPSKSLAATRTRIIENAFQPVDMNSDNKVLQSLLCMGVPNEISPNSRINERLRIRPGAALVLCLGAHERDCMGELDFNAIQVAARLLALGLRVTS